MATPSMVVNIGSDEADEDRTPSDTMTSNQCLSPQTSPPSTGQNAAELPRINFPMTPMVVSHPSRNAFGPTSLSVFPAQPNLAASMLLNRPPGLFDVSPQFGGSQSFTGALPPRQALASQYLTKAPPPWRPRRANLRREPTAALRDAAGHWLSRANENARRVGATVSEKVQRSMSEAKGRLAEAREAFLDWIYSGDLNDTVDLTPPPCPPLSILCQCGGGPTRIRHIDDVTCDECGLACAQCMQCSGVVSRCPHCGAPVRKPLFQCPAMPSLPRSECLLKTCAPSDPRPSPDPRLLVTSVGPFRDARTPAPSRCALLCSGPGLMDCQLCAFDLGRAISARLPMCQRDAPPAPMPGRPLQRLFPGCFPATGPPPRALPFPFYLLRPRKPMPPLRTGLAGAAEDTVVLGMNVANEVVRGVVDGVEAFLPEGAASNRVPGSTFCDCSPPPLRYPVNGYYTDPPDPMTKATGCNIIDGLNNFLDAMLFPPKPLDESIHFEEPEIPPTEETGNVVIDQINNFLDNLLPPPEPRPSNAESLRDRRDPYDALRTMIARFKGRRVARDPPQEGSPFAENFLQLLDQITHAISHPVDSVFPSQNIDYVNFGIAPASTSAGSRSSSGSSTPLIEREVSANGVVVPMIHSS